MNVYELLKKHEGFRAKPYKDTTGHWTIGYGFNLNAGMSRDEADLLLQQRAVKHEEALDKRLSWYRDLNEVRQAVLIDMAYNLGVRGLLTFRKMLKAVAEGDYDRAAEEMLDSLWARQVKTRATRLAKMMRTGEWGAY